MKLKASLHIFFQAFCLVLTLHFVALSVGGTDYLRLFSSKLKLTSVLSKCEDKQNSDASDNLPEPDSDDDDYKNLVLIFSLHVFEKYPFIQISTYHSSLSLFSAYSTKTLMGYSDVILQPPRV